MIHRVIAKLAVILLFVSVAMMNSDYWVACGIVAIASGLVLVYEGNCHYAEL